MNRTLHCFNTLWWCIYLLLSSNTLQTIIAGNEEHGFQIDVMKPTALWYVAACCNNEAGEETACNKAARQESSKPHMIAQVDDHFLVGVPQHNSGVVAIQLSPHAVALCQGSVKTGENATSTVMGSILYHINQDQLIQRSTPMQVTPEKIECIIADNDFHTDSDDLCTEQRTLQVNECYLTSVEKDGPGKYHSTTYPPAGIYCGVPLGNTDHLGLLGGTSDGRQRVYDPDDGGYLLDHYFKDQVTGTRCYLSLDNVPGDIEQLMIFRNSTDADPEDKQSTALLPFIARLQTHSPKNYMLISGFIKRNPITDTISFPTGDLFLTGEVLLPPAYNRYYKNHVPVLHTVSPEHALVTFEPKQSNPVNTRLLPPLVLKMVPNDALCTSIVSTTRGTQHVLRHNRVQWPWMTPGAAGFAIGALCAVAYVRHRISQHRLS